MSGPICLIQHSVLDIQHSIFGPEFFAKKSGPEALPVNRSFTQIFIGDRHIGGSDDLFELDANGGLDPLLKPLLVA